jgi:16S rRNA (uracil1498-N3)-methyltransferase
LVEKLTELGVARFVPLETERSVVHPREGKLDKLQKYVIEASKQSRRNVLMEIRPPIGWGAYCRGSALPGGRFVADLGGKAEKQFAERAGDVAWAVGPEGGFTEGELQAALESGWQAVGLGPRVLRVETAAIAGAALLALRNAPMASHATPTPPGGG